MKTKANTKSRTTPQWVEIYRGKVAGLAYYDAQLHSIKAGDPLSLVLEPDNPHDSNAIRVELKNGTKIGYIPADATENIHNVRRGQELRARVVSWNKDNPIWTRCIILVEARIEPTVIASYKIC